MCLSADWAGTLVLCFPSSFLVLVSFGSSLDVVVLLALFSSFLLSFFILVWCEPGTVSLGLSSASACSCRLFLSGVLWPLCFLVVSPRCAAGFLLFVFFSVWFVSPVAAVFCSLFGCFARFCSWCLGCCGVTRSLLLPPSCPPLVSQQHQTKQQAVKILPGTALRDQ